MCVCVCVCVRLTFAQVAIEVSWGKFAMSTSNKKINNGSTVWNPMEEDKFIDGCFPNFKSDNPRYEKMTADELRQELRKQAPGRFAEEKLATMSEVRLKLELNQLFVGTSMLPDVFVYLRRGDNRIAFARVPARRVFGTDMYKPSWVLLKEDLALNAIPPGETPGSILIR
jgi:hypothetical protein